MNEPKLKIGDYVIALEDLVIPGTGITYYIYKGEYYKLIFSYLWSNGKHAWYVEPIMNRRERRELYGKNPYKGYGYYFSEDELFQSFDCRRVQRRLKLKKLQKIS